MAASTRAFTITPRSAAATLARLWTISSIVTLVRLPAIAQDYTIVCENVNTCSTLALRYAMLDKINQSAAELGLSEPHLLELAVLISGDRGLAQLHELLPVDQWELLEYLRSEIEEAA